MIHIESLHPLVERTDRGDEMFAVMVERSGYMALDLDALSLI